jgi:hypothetical protein
MFRVLLRWRGVWGQMWEWCHMRQCHFFSYPPF